jgi:hypothetical protein
MIRLFFELLIWHLLWLTTRFKDILRVFLAEWWEDRVINTHLLVISIRFKSFWWTYYNLLSTSFRIFFVTYSLVASEQDRLRIIIHVYNTKEQVKGFVNVILAWVQEMMHINSRTMTKLGTKATKKIYDWMRQKPDERVWNNVIEQTILTVWSSWSYHNA